MRIWSLKISACVLVVASACSHLGRQNSLPLQSFDQEESYKSLASKESDGKSTEYVFAKSLQASVAQSLKGLMFLPEEEQQRLLLRASGYVQARRKRASEEEKQSFVESCPQQPFQQVEQARREPQQADPGIQEGKELDHTRFGGEDPFCWLYYKSLEPPPVRRARPRSPAPAGVSAAQVRQWLLGGEHQKLKELSERDIRRGVAGLRDLNSLNRAIAKSGLSDGCELPFVSMSLAAKLEEHLPKEEVRHKVVELYERAADCDEGITGVRASFRAAVMGLWVHGCSRALPYLERIAFHPQVPDYQSRGLYWILSCSKEVEAQAELVARAAAALQAQYPVSLQNILASSDRGSRARDFLSRLDSRLWLRLPKEHDVWAVNAWLDSVESLEELEEATLAREALMELIRRVTGGEIGDLDPRLRLYLAVLLDRHEDHLNKFRILAPLLRDHQKLLSQSSLQLFYPNNYFVEETEGDRDNRLGKENQWGVDTFLLLALIRQESAFQKRARSPAGARGLMQLMPRTARSFERVSLEDLYDPEINKRIGAKYLRQLLNRYDGDVEVVLAAYNAGPSRIAEWLRRYPTDDRMLFVDLFPFRETRDYVGAIARNYYWYRALYGQDLDSSESVAQPAASDTSYSFQILRSVLEP